MIFTVKAPRGGNMTQRAEKLVLESSQPEEQAALAVLGQFLLHAPNVAVRLARFCERSPELRKRAREARAVASPESTKGAQNGE